MCSCAVESFLFFFFFKQKTAYEMRISDWSSDVCSSDLGRGQATVPRPCGGCKGPVVRGDRRPLLPKAPTRSRLSQSDRTAAAPFDGGAPQTFWRTSKMSLLEASPVYKPFRYPWAYDAWLMQQRLHWLPEEVALADDVKDWNRNLTDGERNLLSQIFRFFTQADVEVNNCYMKHYARVFQPTEVQMMLAAFSNMETVHIAAYSYLLDTIGMPEAEYSAFLHYKEMKDKYDYMQEFGCDTKEQIAKTLAVFGAFTEGLQLFASFAILLNFPRFNKMKGMGQIITWSVRDESLHPASALSPF